MNKIHKKILYIIFFNALNLTVYASNILFVHVLEATSIS